MENNKFGYTNPKNNNIQKHIDYFEENNIPYKNIHTKSNPITFENLVDEMSNGDILFLYNINQLSSDYTELRSMVARLNQKQINIQIKDMPTFVETDNDLYNTFIKDMILQSLMFITDYNHQQVINNQREGIDKAKKQGAYQGMPRKYSANSKSQEGRLIYKSIVEELKDGATIKSLVRKYKVGVGTVQRIKRELEEESS